MDMILNQVYILSSSELREISKMMIGVLLFILCCIGIHFVTKFVRKQQIFNNRNSNIHIIETIAIGPQKYLQLVKIIDKCLLIGVTKDNIIFIKEFDNEDIILNNNEIEDTFKKVLDKFKSKSRNE